MVRTSVLQIKSHKKTDPEAKIQEQIVYLGRHPPKPEGGWGKETDNKGITIARN